MPPITSAEQNAIGQHYHLSRQILDENSGSQSSGGSVTISGTGGGSVSNVSTLQVAGVVAESAPGTAVQGLVFTQIGPLRIHYNDAGLVNPTNFGIEIGPELPSGAFIEVFGVGVVPFVGAGATSRFLDLQIGTAEAATPNTTLNEVDLFNFQTADRVGVEYAQLTTPALASPGPGAITTINTTLLRAQVPSSGLHIVVGIYTDQPMTAGEADVYAIIATPAA